MPLITHYFQPTLPEALYHYSGIGSLLGIAKNKCVWAGSVRYMNDSQELLQSFDRVDELLTHKVNSSPVGNLRYDFELQFLRWMAEMRDATNLHVFAFSLSEVPSLLSQWRSYTPHGKGVSIGFSRVLLDRITAGGQFRLGKCLYSHDDQDELIESLLNSLWGKCEDDPTLQQGNHPAPGWRYYPVFERNRSDIYHALALMKHEAFQEEREWRLVSSLVDGLGTCNFREGGTMLVPYIEIALNSGGANPLFHSLTVGPTPHEDLSMPALKGYLAKENLCTSVRHCAIPYREW